MPVYQVGDLVRWNLSPCDLEVFDAVGMIKVFDAVGMIIELRQLQWQSPECRVLWADEGVSQWCDVRDITVMQTEAECGTT